MSGIAAGYGRAVNDQAIQTMLATMSHRGPAWSGLARQPRWVLGQNYSLADLGLRHDPASAVESDWAGNGPQIAYDGQIGNWSELADPQGVPDGPRRDERLLVRLYQQEGPAMLGRLSDAMFSLVIGDGSDLLAARDVLGIKTLFYGRKAGVCYFGSELKSVLSVADEVYEFPPGHYMDRTGQLQRFAELAVPERPLAPTPEEAAARIRELVWRSFCQRVHFAVPTAALLSGGLDSSIVCCLAARRLEEQQGPDARLTSFAVGVGESQDIVKARRVAAAIGSLHQELIVDLERVLEVLPEVIYYLESFDPSLVRSAVANYLVSGFARERGFEQLLSGEGGDETFCGYEYIKQYGPRRLLAEQLRCLGFVHSNAALRLDRMNQCHGLRVVTPLLSGALLDYALRLPAEYKQKPADGGKIEKWILRLAYESWLPADIVWRPKQEFSQGTEAADVLPSHFESRIGDEEFAAARREHPLLRSKEELHYFRVFAEHFGTGSAVQTVGQWVSL